MAQQGTGRALAKTKTTTEDTVKTPTHDEIAALAYVLWRQRGAGEGSSEEDWLQAERQLIAERAPSREG